MKTRAWLLLGAAAGAGWYLHERGKEAIGIQCANALPKGTPLNEQYEAVQACQDEANLLDTLVMGLKQATAA